MLTPSSSFIDNRHKWEDKRKNGKRKLVLFLGAIEDQNVGISLLPSRWKMAPEWRIGIWRKVEI